MSLPECAARAALERNDVFYCRHPLVHTARRLVSREVCLGCALATTAGQVTLLGSPRYPQLSPDTPCVFLGELRRLELCSGCHGRVQIKVFQCQHPAHEETTLSSCQLCVDFEPRLGVE